MRAPAVLLAVLLLAPLLPPAAGQEDAAFLTDPEGDTELVAGAAGQEQGVTPPMASARDTADLLALDVTEAPDRLTFTVQAKSFAETFPFGASYRVYFTWQGAEYRINFYVGKSETGLQDYEFVYLTRATEDGRHSFVEELPYEVDVEAGTLSATVLKVQIVSEENRIPVVGSTLTDVRVESEGFWRICCFTRTEVRDLMPDEGGAEYEFTQGNQAIGHLEFEAPDPVRVSNGGGTTIVFEAFVHNTGTAPDTVEYAVEDMPPDWDATVHASTKIPAGESKKVHVITTIPFKHIHGGFTAFNLTATSSVDPAAVATTQFGVLHTPIAQPAGHHPDLYLHAEQMNSEPWSSVFPWAPPYMNTESDHANDAETATVNYYDGGPGWRIPLGPPLAMGLDFDLEGEGTLVGSILGNTRDEGVVHAKLWLDPEGDDNAVLLAESDEVTIPLDLQMPSPFELKLTPTEDADYVPYDPQQNLILTLMVEPNGPDFCCLTGTTPELVVADFRMTLPLNEYADRVRALDGAGAVGPELTPQGATEKAAKPGGVVAYGFTLVNTGTETDRYAIEVTGSDADLASVTPQGTVELGPGESRLVVLQMQVPPNANPEQVFEALVLARSESDPSLLAIGSTLTRVALEGSATDNESEELLRAAADEQEKDTPGFGVLPLAGALTGLALATRRRRD